MAAASGSTSLDLVGTIEDDDCVSLEESEESEDEENVSKSAQLRLSAIFNLTFCNLARYYFVVLICA